MANLFSVKDKVVVMTGAAGILGRTISSYLAGEGAKMVILDRNEEAGNELVNNIKAAGNEAIFLYTDVLNKEVLLQNKKDIIARYGRIDVLLNAAGGNMAGATIAHNGICRRDGETKRRGYRKFQLRIGSTSTNPCRRLWCSKSRNIELYKIYGRRTCSEIRTGIACQRHCSGIFPDRTKPHFIN